MVNISDISTINALYLERTSVANAISIIENGGSILNMTLGYRDEQPPNAITPMGDLATVNTIDMQYPQQMVDSIKQLLNQRMAQIERELSDLGISNQPARRR